MTAIMPSVAPELPAVSRRIKNPYSTVDNDTIGQMYTFALKDGFVVDGRPGFVLQPYDEVYVRRSPGYQPQQNVSVEGESIPFKPVPLMEKSIL